MPELSLPEWCYVYVPIACCIGIVQKGETGYKKTDIYFTSPDEGKKIVEDSNKGLGVTKAQALAMEYGSIFGWELPGADPKEYSQYKYTQEKSDDWCDFIKEETVARIIKDQNEMGTDDG